ncbi:YitT family protein [Amphibiibacter pelophylacis]|uniref:YitT family protein n=1 Tax=Amphibiibacter pelophylacis TaxID=1799477 RepID=A0ACC6P092_9BURK
MSKKHRWHEDLLALINGTALVALGVLMYQSAHLLTGGTTGIGFLLHYLGGWNMGLLLTLVNLPFYVLAWYKLGPAMTLRTIAAVALLGVWINVFPRWITLGPVQPLFAAILGGLLMGVGMLILFRHRTSLGGINVLVIYLQERYGWRAGQIQMAIDCCIVLLALAEVPWTSVMLSVAGAVMLNLTLALNHRPGRYLGVS